MDSTDKSMMQKCLRLARRAAKLKEVPVGAIVVDENGKILSQAYNLRESLKTCLAHAEILALHRACKKKDSWRLNGCTLYVNLEPCPMCAGAIVQSRIKRVVYGAADPKAGAATSIYQILNDERLNHRCEITAGVLTEESRDLLKKIFKKLRVK